jgi:cytochrome c-type biogenesis protein CcmH/NrfG
MISRDFPHRSTARRSPVKRSFPILLAILAIGVASTAGAATPPPKKAEKPAKAEPAKTAPAKTDAAKPAEVDTLGMLEKAVAKDSSKVDNLYKLGVMYLDRDRPVEAVRVLAKANKLKPNQPKSIINLGAALDAVGQPDLAQDQYRQALKITPGDSVAMCRLASSLYSQGKHAESMDILRETIAKKPDSYCAYFTLGVAFADAGIYRDAVRMWQKVLDLAPSSPEAVSAKESIEVLEKFLAAP